MYIHTPFAPREACLDKTDSTAIELELVVSHIVVMTQIQISRINPTVNKHMQQLSVTQDLWIISMN